MGPLGESTTACGPCSARRKALLSCHPGVQRSSPLDSACPRKSNPPHRQQLLLSPRETPRPPIRQCVVAACPMLSHAGKKVNTFLRNMVPWQAGIFDELAHVLFHGFAWQAWCRFPWRRGQRGKILADGSLTRPSLHGRIYICAPRGRCVFCAGIQWQGFSASKRTCLLTANLQ